MAAPTNGVGIVAGVVAVVLSLLSALNRVLDGRTAEALPQLGLAAVMSALVVYLIRRRRAGPVRPADGNRLKVEAVLLFGFFVLLSAALIVFAGVEAIGNHAYGWLLLIPLGLWGLRVHIVGMGRVLRADPDEMMRRVSGDGVR